MANTPQIIRDVVAKSVASVILALPESREKCVPPLVCPKVDVPQDIVGPCIERREGLFLPDGMPARVPVTVPVGESLHLNLRLISRLGRGRASLVYSVAQKGDTPHLPPLVIKVARKSFNTFITREAWFYDELACLQGSVIPRCFGLFSVKIPDSSAHDWDRIRCDHPSTRNPDELERQTAMKDLYDGTSIGEFKEELLQSVCNSDHLTFLVLERLVTPEDTLNKDNDTIKNLQKRRKQAWDLHRCLADLGIHHGDLKLHDIMLPSPHWPTLPCPVGRCSGKVFKWRVIDFEMSQKNNEIIDLADANHTLYLDVIFYRPFLQRHVWDGNEYVRRRPEED